VGLGRSGPLPTLLPGDGRAQASAPRGRLHHCYNAIRCYSDVVQERRDWRTFLLMPQLRLVPIEQLASKLYERRDAFRDRDDLPR